MRIKTLIMAAFCPLFLGGCYVTKLLPDENLTIEEDDILTSYNRNDGLIIPVPPPGLRYEDAFFSNDSLNIVLSGRQENQAGRITYYDRIPVSDIYSVNLLPSSSRLRYGHMGAAYGTGTFASGGFTFINSLVGFSISGRSLWYRARYLPDDYTGLFRNNNIYTLSTMVVFGGRPNNNGIIWLGMEFGPSYVNFRKEVETLNPNYGEGWLFPDLNKYIRDNEVYHAIGLTARMKFDVMFSNNWGVELALYGNLNRYRSNYGFECNLLFGKVR